MLQNLLGLSENPVYNTIIRWMWRFVVAIPIFVIIFFIGLSFTELPSVTQLENPRSKLATEVIGSNGDVLGRYYSENRVQVTYNDLSPHLVKALISTEDERFHEHSGIDFKALGRVLFKTVLTGQQSAGGGSTITQQLAKLLFTGSTASNIVERGFQKLKEWIIAVRLERRYTKEEIIAMYLNKFEFNYNAFGVQAAAETYFGKSQDELELHEAAMLIGMLKNPSLFDPLRFPDTTMHRRMVVLKQMAKNNIISEARYDSLRVLPLGLNYTKTNHVTGLAPYFRTELSKDVKKILDLPQNRKSDGSKYNIYQDGLRIYTTIDPKLQRMAEEEMTKHMAKIQKVFFRHWKNYDIWTYQSKSKLETSLKTRDITLKRLVRESDRYQSLRDKYLSKTINKLKEEFPEARFSPDDREIERMIAAYNKKGTPKLSDASKKVMRSSLFPTLMKDWETMQEVAKEQFNKPTAMRVFAYNEKMEADTTMTPLDSIKYHRMFLQAGIMAVDPRDGFVKVWVGGINYKYFKYDHVRINRQVGSTFKPFIYATAIQQQGFSPCYQVYDLPVTIGPGDGSFYLQDPWTPNNSDGEYSGAILNLKEGLRRSKNTVSAFLMKQLGNTEPVRDLVHELGISKDAKYPNGRFRVPRAPSIALGSTDLSVLEMTGAYTAFANNGVYNKPVFIKKIEDKNGRVLYRYKPVERQALEPNANYVMVELLRYAATGLGQLKCDKGGKTGTTNEYVDGWFMGITPNLVVGTWVGGEERWIRFRDILYGQGSYMAKPFFRKFIKRIEADDEIDFDEGARFYRPPGDLGIELDCSKYSGDFVPVDTLNREGGFREDDFGDEAFQREDGFDDEGFREDGN